MRINSLSPTSSSHPRRSRCLAALLLIGAASCSPQNGPAMFKRNQFRPGPTPPVPLRVYGDGRACMGYVHLTRHAFVWKWHWATCRADGWTVVARDATSWTLQLKQTPAEVKACLGVRFVELEPTEIDIDKSSWSFAGLERQGQSNEQIPIACSAMM